MTTRVLVETPTMNREVVLGRCLACLLNQTFQDFDIFLSNDGDRPIGYTRTAHYLLELLSKEHDIWIEDGSHISQAHNHNMPLYDTRFRGYKYILRMDDDVLLNKFAMQFM